MAESNATQVILTDDGIKIINAQNTADNASGGVANLNDPNLMSVIEKQTQTAQYAGLTSQYNVILKRAKDANVSTTDLTTAYTRLNTFMTAILMDTTKASDVNRDTYKSLTDAYNTALSNVQTALSNNFNTDMDNMQSSVSVASQAASSAAIVASQATVTGNSASQMASQAVVIASQAQITGNNATSVANNASQAASSAVLAGSTATVSANKAITAASQAQSAGNNATSIANNASQAASSAILVGSQAAVSANKASADYQTLSAGVKDGSVVHITTETVIDKGVIGTAQIANGAITNAQIGNAAVNSAKIADLAVGTAQIGDGAITNAKIGSLAVGTAQIANGAITNAQIGSLAVDTANIKDAAISSAKIANLAVGTAQIGDGAITNAKIGKLAVGTAQIANAAITDAQIGNVSANKLTAGTIDFNTITGKNINASNITTGTLDTNRLNVNKLSALSANLGDVTTGSLKGVDIVANTFSTPNGSFTTDANGNVVASNLTIRGVTNLVYNAALLGNSGTYPNTKVPGWNLFTKGYYSNATLHDGVPSIGFNSSTGSGTWVTFAQSKLYPLNGLHGQPYSASVWFIDDGSEAAMKYQFTLAFFDANGNRLASGYAGNTWNGNPTAQGWAYKTIDNIISPSTAVYVAIQYWAYNGTGHALFSSPMLTQTAQSTGYQPDTGNVVSAGEIDGSVINGSTINGTTFNAGDIINNTNNTANYYPMTITPDGAYKSTYFDSRVALRASVQSGAIIYDYRSMLPDGNGKYIYSSTTIHGQGITIDSGHTDTKDSTFNGYRTGGSYISLTPSAGLLLHGSDANINFGGHLKDNEFDEGMYMNPYGNIIGKSASDYWQISKQGTDNTGGGPTARFGIDTGGKGTINFYRPLFVDEIGGFTDSNGNALFIHGNDDGKSGSTGQMLFRKDGRSAQIVSASIYNRTYSGGSNVTVTSYGTLGRITSASKYKLDITKETSISPANKLLSIDMSSWIDKSSAEQLSDSKTNGTDLSEPEMNVFRHYGLIAEDLIKAGLDEFVIKGDNGQAEGIEYDRLWTVLIPKIRQLSNDQIQNKMTIAKLGSEIEELKQGR
ncbi:beta strand repeat-containing protein [Lactiplantibacillus pentosus]